MSLLLIASATFPGCEGSKEEPRVVADGAGALIIAYSPDSADTFVNRGADSVAALDWLRRVAATHHIEIATKSYPFGTLVEQIGPRRNGDGGFWLYKVNGQMVPKASDTYRVAASDTVTFFFDER